MYASEEPNFLQKHHVIFPMPTSTDHSFRSRLFSREREMARPKRARDDFFSQTSLSTVLSKILLQCN